MTEDYKMITKDWIANTLTTGDVGSWQLIYNIYSNNQDIYANYNTDAVVKCYKQVISPKSVGVMWTILALWSDTLLKGRFVILDENNEIVDMIDQYTSGVDIGCYYCIDLDEKGRLYGIEWFNQERVRFVMLNNIAIPRGTEYYADIRKTYDVPTLNGYSPVQESTATAYMVKCKDTAKYGFITIFRSRTNFYTFEINVESGNTWKGTQLGGVGYNRNPLIKYDSDNMFTCYIINMSSQTNPYIIREKYTETQDDITTSYIQVFTDSDDIAVPQADIIWNDENNVIIPFYTTDYQTFKLKKINLSNETTFTSVYEEDYFSEKMTVKIYKTNGYLFMYILGSGVSQYAGWKESIYHIFDPTFDSSPMSSVLYEEVLNDELGDTNVNDVDMFIVQNQYNLYNYLIGKKITQNNTTKIYLDIAQEIYNENNYNGTPYIGNISSPLNPTQFVLYHKETGKNRILYVRDIYNKTAYGNIVDVSLEIPNYLINDIEINNEQLWGDTKIVMNDEHEVITKNKYEELILTIRNRLNVIDNNNNENILLENISEILNKAMHRITQTSQIGLSIQKAKINYTDNTSELINTTSTKNNDTSTISFTITPSKEISSIEYVSLNNTSFLTIAPTLEVGSNYVITQDVRIGD